MEEILGTVAIDEQRYLHIAELSADTVIENGAEHLGFGGYFLFEEVNAPQCNDLVVLGKAASLGAAIQLANIFHSFGSRG